MTQPVTIYVDVSVTLEGVGPQPAGFGTPMLVHETTVEPGSRLHGPFTSVQDVLDFGYLAGSPPALFAAAITSQQPRARQFYIGAARAADADLSESLAEIDAESAGRVYCAMIESRDESDILDLAAWQEARGFGIALAQSSEADLLDATTPNVGSLLRAGNYTRTALVYHPTDAQFLDASWASRCLAFDLDRRKGGWAFKRLNGISGTNLSGVEVANLRDENVNYFSPVVMSAGDLVQASTAQGWTAAGDAGAGRRIDVVTSLDWARARLEEALFGVLLREPHDVPFTDAGINRFAAAAAGVISNVGVSAGHFVPFVVPEGEDREGTATPVIDVPKLRDTLQTERVNRTLSMTALAYLRSSIERVQFNIEVRQ